MIQFDGCIFFRWVAKIHQLVEIPQVGRNVEKGHLLHVVGRLEAPGKCRFFHRFWEAWRKYISRPTRKDFESHVDIESDLYPISIFFLGADGWVFGLWGVSSRWFLNSDVTSQPLWGSKSFMDSWVSSHRTDAYMYIQESIQHKSNSNVNIIYIYMYTQLLLLKKVLKVKPLRPLQTNKDKQRSWQMIGFQDSNNLQAHPIARSLVAPVKRHRVLGCEGWGNHWPSSWEWRLGSLAQGGCGGVRVLGPIATSNKLFDGFFSVIACSGLNFEEVYCICWFGTPDLSLIWHVS